MDFGGTGERSIPEIWFEPADARRFAVVLGRILAVLGGAVVALGSVAVLVVTERIERNERFEDERLAVTVAAAPEAERVGLIAAAGREAMVVDPTSGSGSVVEIIVAAERPDARTRAWLSALAGRVPGPGSDTDVVQVDSVDPGGGEWWHSAVALDDGRTLVLQRPRSTAMATATALWQWAAGTAALLLAGLVVLWLLLRRPMERSTTYLLEAVEDLRILGRLREGVRGRLRAIPSRPVELKRLSGALLDIETDVGRTFAQVDSLLRAAVVLGSSLDPDVVLAASLQRLQHLLGADRSAILRYDHRLRNFTVVATRDHSPRYLAAMTEATAEPTTPSVQAILRQVPIQIADTDSEFTRPALRERARQNGYRSVLAVPLPPVLEQPTVLVLHKVQPYTYSYDEIDLSISFAAMAAAALRNAELFARTDQDLGRLSSRLTAIIESVDEGLLVQSTDGTVIYANSAMRALASTTLADPRPGPDPDPDHRPGPDPDPGPDPGPGHRAGADRRPDADPENEAPADLPSAGHDGGSYLSVVLRGCDDPGAAAARIEGLADADGAWCEVELGPGGGGRTFRVRRFSVTDARDRALGHGLVFTDVTADRAVDDLKAALLATVSHEFRTPLALIKGYATTLLADDVDWHPDDRQDFLRLVVSEADRLSDLVQRLLDLRRIDAGMLDLETVPVELDGVIDQAVAGIADDRQRVTVGEVPAVLVAVDQTRIVTALRNLVENACRYSPATGSVVVTARLTPRTGPGAGGGHQVEIDVADRGPGVPPELADAVFDLFVRADPAADGGGERGGTGLGLAIARGFVEAHGGALRYEARPGGGSLFRIVLPDAVAERSSIEPAPADLAPPGSPAVAPSGGPDVETVGPHRSGPR